MELFRPVKWEANRDWRLTQGWGSDFMLKGKLYYKSMGFAGHMGIDYAGATPGVGVPVYAAHDGIVVVAGVESGWGNHVRIEGAGFQTNYAHLAEIYVKKWDHVKAMQPIGFMGNTGTGTGIHLHFGLRPVPFDVNNGFKGYINPTDNIVNWREVVDPTLKYWQSIPHFFDQYTDKNPITGEEARRLIDIALARAWITPK